MESTKPMTLLLIEDDTADCVKFKDCANRRNDIVFVGMTGSSDEGMQYVKTRMPEGVILDLELHRGRGSGIAFLEALNNTNMELRPIIAVTTNSPSALVYNHVRDMGVDMVFYKRQVDYSADMVVNTLLALRKSLYTVTRDGLPGDLQTIESPEERRVQITKRISVEMDLIGINVRFKGRRYSEESIYMLLTKEKGASENVFKELSFKYNVTYSSIVRAIQTAINNAWASSGIEDLERHYTARINIQTGVPSPTEFIHYYADKIRKTL